MLPYYLKNKVYSINTMLKTGYSFSLEFNH